MFCSECGKQVADNAKFCESCGAVQTTAGLETTATAFNRMQSCPSCNVKGWEHGKQCRSCGYVEGEKTSNRNKLQASVTSAPNSSNAPFLYFKAIGAIVVILVVGGYFVAGKKEDAPVVATSEEVQAVTQTAEEKAALAAEQLRKEVGAENNRYQAVTQTAEEKAALAAEGERMRAASVERENTRFIDFQNMFACTYPYAEGMAYQLAVTIANVAANSSYGYASMLTTGDTAKFCQQAFGSASEENIQKARQIAVRGNITYWVVDRGNAAVGMMSRR